MLRIGREVGGLNTIWQAATAVAAVTTAEVNVERATLRPRRDAAKAQEMPSPPAEGPPAQGQVRAKHCGRRVRPEQCEFRRGAHEQKHHERRGDRDDCDPKHQWKMHGNKFMKTAITVFNS